MFYCIIFKVRVSIYHRSDVITLGKTEVALSDLYNNIFLIRIIIYTNSCSLNHFIVSASLTFLRIKEFLYVKETKSMLHQLKLLLYFLMSQFVPLLSFLVKRRRIEFCKCAGCCATLIRAFWSYGNRKHSLGPEQAGAELAQLICWQYHCSLRWRSPHGEVASLQMRRSAEPKQRRLCPICPGSVQGLRAVRGALLQLGAFEGARGRGQAAPGRLAGPLAQLGPLGKGRRRMGRQGGPGLDSRRESERDPVTRRRLQFS